MLQFKNCHILLIVKKKNVRKHVIDLKFNNRSIYSNTKAKNINPILLNANNPYNCLQFQAEIYTYLYLGVKKILHI